VVRVPEIPDGTFPGKVKRVADGLQLSSRTLLTEFNMPNPDGAFSLGICCTIELHIRRKTPSYKVPPMRSFSMKPGLQVAVVENGVARLRKVAVVSDFGQQVEVNSDVKRGDQVILDPAVDLVDGSKGTNPAPADADILTPAPDAAGDAAERHANFKTLFNGASDFSNLCF
jgi:multidrug efflux pump subunit AcrA (membrane-fusion protein)